jgi:hypothetical protein
MDINRYLVTSVYLDYDFSVNYETPLHKVLEKIPELKDIAQKIEDLLGISKVYYMHVFSEEDFDDLRSLNLTYVQKKKLLELAEKVKLAEEVREKMAIK